MPAARHEREHAIRSGHIVAHIRKATVGGVALANTHPFQRELWGRWWVFAHNGTLKDSAPRLHGAFRPVGQTDSEAAFCRLMRALAKAHAAVPSVEELSATPTDRVAVVATEPLTADETWTSMRPGELLSFVGRVPLVRG